MEVISRLVTTSPYHCDFQSQLDQINSQVKKLSESTELYAQGLPPL